MLPSLFRTELWHPLTVQFPLALLLTGTLLRTISAVANSRRPFFYQTAALITLLGTLGAWVAWFTGNRAEEIVNANLCDPTITHLHGDLALYVVLIFSVVSIVDVTAYFAKSKRWPSSEIFDKRTVHFVILLISMSGAGLLGYVGHLGAGLTYNQAAGVHVPDALCTEFGE